MVNSSTAPASIVSTEVEQCLDKLAALPEVDQALEFMQHDHDQRIQEQIEISEIPASPFKEDRRAEDYGRRMAQLGLETVRRDEEGNVIGWLKGRGDGPKLFVSAHLDTVFPPGYDPKVRVDDTGVLHGPGICDDAAGLSLLLSLVRTLKDSDLRPVGDIGFVGTVGEEGVGDLRGVKHLCATHSGMDGFISIDGGGSHSVTYLALGSKRFEFVFRGIGGHSFGAYGQVANPIHAMGRAIANIAALVLPQDPKTTLAVSVVSGGTSVNSIAHQAKMLTDTRSVSPGQLGKTVAQIQDSVRAAVQAENMAWGLEPGDTGAVNLVRNLIGDRPSGVCRPDAIHVQAAGAATRLIGLEPELLPPGSTDASIPISLGIPALALGRGGKEMYIHSLQEAFDPTDAYLAGQRILLVTLALAGLQQKSEPLLPRRARTHP